MRGTKTQGECRTLEELVAYAWEQGKPYPEAWANHVLEGREARRRRRASSVKHLRGRPYG